MYDEVRVVAVTVLVTVLGAGVGGWWTSERGWPAEAVAVVAGALAVYLGAVPLGTPLSSLAVAVAGLGCLAVGSVSPVLRSVGLVLLAAAVADAELAAVFGGEPHECMRFDRPLAGGGWGERASRPRGSGAGPRTVA